MIKPIYFNLISLKSTIKSIFNLEKYGLITWFVLYCTLEISTSFVFNPQINKFSTIFVHFISYFLVYYSNFKIIFPLIIKNKTRVKGFFLLTIQIVLFTIYSIAVRYLLEKFKLPNLEDYKEDFSFFIGKLYRYIFFCLLSYFAFIAKQSILEQKRILQLEIDKQKVEKQKIIADLQLLQSRINPHFLFNTLNYLYVYFKKIDANIGEMIMKISEIMRYSITDANADGKISLIEEVEQIDNLLYLVKMKEGDAFQYEFKKEGILKFTQIPPFILLSFLENAIKYGKLKNAENNLYIYLNSDYDNDKLTFIIKNEINYKNEINTSHQIGIKSIENKLANYYKNNFKLNIKSENNIFSVELIINF